MIMFTYFWKHVSIVTTLVHSSNNHDMTKFSRESTWQLLSLADRVDKCNEMLDKSRW